MDSKAPPDEPVGSLSRTKGPLQEPVPDVTVPRCPLQPAACPRGEEGSYGKMLGALRHLHCRMDTQYENVLQQQEQVLAKQVGSQAEHGLLREETSSLTARLARLEATLADLASCSFVLGTDSSMIRGLLLDGLLTFAQLLQVTMRVAEPGRGHFAHGKAPLGYR